MSFTNRSTANLLRRYLTGAITAPEEAELERRARADEPLAEALRGLRSVPEEDHAARVSNLLAAARQQGQTVAEVVPTRPNRYRWAAAAAVLLLVVSSLFILPALLDRNAGDLAMTSAPQREEAPPVAKPQPEIAPAEPVTAAPEEDASPAPAPSSSASDPRPRPENESKDAPKVTASAEERRAAARDQAAEESRRETARKKEQRKQTAPPPGFEAEMLDEEMADEAPAPAATRRIPPAPAPAVTTAPPAAGAVARARRQPGNATDDSLDNDAAAGYSQPLNNAFLDGRITNENGYPIRNALVRVPGLPLGERTDSNGIFQLPADAVVTALDVSHPDYESERVDLTNTTEKLQISLERKPFTAEDDRPRWQQNGSSTRIVFDEKPGYASPIEGYNALRQRIENNKPADVPRGKVKLSFLVNPDGTLTDFQFRGKPDQATMDYIGTTLVTTSVWEVVQGDEPVRVYFKVVFR